MLQICCTVDLPSVVQTLVLMPVKLETAFMGRYRWVLKLCCVVRQVDITRPYLCANHLAAPYTGLPASYAEAPSEAPPPQSASGASGEGYGAGMKSWRTFCTYVDC